MGDSDLIDKGEPSAKADNGTALIPHSIGVAALGARRKLLKAFANIRTHYGIPHPEGYSPDADPVNADDGNKEGGSQSGN